MSETDATEAAVAAARRGSTHWEVMLEGRGVTFVTADAMTTFHQRPTKRHPERVERMDMEFRDTTGKPYRLLPGRDRLGRERMLRRSRRASSGRSTGGATRHGGASAAAAAGSLAGCELMKRLLIPALVAAFVGSIVLTGLI